MFLSLSEVEDYQDHRYITNKSSKQEFSSFYPNQFPQKITENLKKEMHNNLNKDQLKIPINQHLSKILRNATLPLRN